jgi:hypothetical protein
VLVGQLTLCLCVALVLVATMWASILSKRTGPAIIASFIFSYLSLFGPLSLIMIYTFTSDGRHVDDTWLNVSPVFSYGQFVYQWEWHRVISSAWSLSMSIHSFAVYALYKGVIRHYAARVSTKRS